MPQPRSDVPDQDEASAAITVLFNAAADDKHSLVTRKALMQVAGWLRDQHFRSRGERIVEPSKG